MPRPTPDTDECPLCGKPYDQQIAKVQFSTGKVSNGTELV